jgi:hypothetical protein
MSQLLLVLTRLSLVHSKYRSCCRESTGLSLVHFIQISGLLSVGSEPGFRWCISDVTELLLLLSRAFAGAF